MNVNNQNPENQKPKKSPWGDIFLGLGLALLLFIAMVATLYIGNVGKISIIGFILMSASTFLSVRLIRRNHPIAGKIMLGVIIPLTLLLLLFGACSITLGGL